MCSLFVVSLSSCNGGGGSIDSSSWSVEKKIALPPGSQWNKVVPLGVPAVRVPKFPSFKSNDAKITYDVVNDVLYAQHMNGNLAPFLLDKQHSPYWFENNDFQELLVTNNISVTSYLDADDVGNIYGFGLNGNNQVILIKFNDTTHSLNTYPITGYPTITQFGNLYYASGMVYALASTLIGDSYSYSLVQFSASNGDYQKTIDLNYTSPNLFANVFSLPANPLIPFKHKIYLSGVIGDDNFFINENGVVTAISLHEPLTHRQVGDKFISNGLMASAGIGGDVTVAELSPLAYSRGQLFACGLIPENEEYGDTYSIFQIHANAESTITWESIGYTQPHTIPQNNKIVYYNACMNIVGYGNKVFANDNTNEDTTDYYPYSAMVYESTIQ